jgi:hypothetical protein
MSNDPNQPQSPQPQSDHVVDDQQRSDCLEDESVEAANKMLSESGAALDEIIAEADAGDAPSANAADVFIQAGHFNHHSWDKNTGCSGPLGDEIDWTPVVVNEATSVLREAGVSVIKSDASIKNSPQKFNVKVAVFVHFDGSKNPNAGGASVGYDHDSDRDAATAWKQLYSNYYTFGWHADNYTKDLEGYYGFRNTVTQDAEFVIELGTLSNLQEAQWLKPRLQWLGRLVAHYLSDRIGKGGVPDPGPFA